MMRSNVVILFRLDVNMKADFDIKFVVTVLIVHSYSNKYAISPLHVTHLCNAAIKNSLLITDDDLDDYELHSMIDL